MNTIRVNLAENSYEVQIGSGLLDGVAEGLKVLRFSDKAVVITNPHIKRLYGDLLISNLEAAGFTTAVLEVPDGEEYKSLDEAAKLYQQLSDFQAERMTPILALGGGVIGDLSGFVAATYLRGVPLVQLPTTLLAQVDSSVGGKTAVNHGHLKNNIGAFYQPKLVIADIATLDTLPKSEFTNGLAEVIKYGIIRDKELFYLLQNRLERITTLNQRFIEEAIVRCISIKAEITEKDEKDLGLRNILNFGHTMGHAIEIAANYRIKHGRAVAMGMVAAAMISQKMGILATADLEKIKTVILAAGLPLKFPRLDIEKIIEAMEHDKKKAGGKIRFILPKTIGEVLNSRRSKFRNRKTSNQGNGVKNPRICVSIVENNLGLVKKIEPDVDLFEMRLDLIGPEWRNLVKFLKKPWIACNRSREEGGKGDPDEQKRIDKLLRAAEAGASIVDIEFRSRNLKEIVPLIRAKARCLISYHDAVETPVYETLVSIVESQIKAGADICKIVTTARKWQDNLTVLKLIRHFPETRMIAFAMGEEGRISRILAPLAGGYLTYACAEPGLESAAGQIPLAELKEMYGYLL